MKTIAFWNRKGGVGKTTTAGNIACELAHSGRVLVVDCDSQANLTSWLGPKEFEFELADVLCSSASLIDAVVNVRDQIDLLPTFAIGGSLGSFAETQLASRPFVFSDLRDSARAAGYQYVVIDLAPASSILERYALSVADEVVLVVMPEFFSTDGIETAQEVLKDVAANLRGRFNATKIVVNRINRSYAAHGVLLDSFRPEASEVFKIGQSTAIHDALISHQLLSEYEPGNKYANEYLRLAETLR